MDNEIKLGKYRGRYAVQWYEPCKGATGVEWRLRRYGLGLAYNAENRDKAEQLLAEYKAKQTEVTEATVKAVWRSYKISSPEGRQFYGEKHLLPFFGDLDTNKISVPMCQAYIQRRRNAGAGNATIRRELACLKAAVRKHAPEGHRNFVFEMPPAPPPRERYLTREEFKLLRSTVAPTDHLALFVEIAIATGARKSAICQMKWSQVDFDRKLVDLRGDGGAANKRRAVVPMTDNLYERLCEAKSVALTDHVIEFNGSPIKRIDIAFRRRVERVPQLADGTPHVLRHTAAVWMAEGGVPMSQISQFLGHTNTKITESVYARFSPDFLRHAAVALNI